MSGLKESPMSRIELGLAAAHKANHEFDVWKRVERATRETEDTAPEGISPDETHDSFLAKVAIGGKIIGKDSGAIMTDQGLQFPDRP